jgi:hypothetical protein
MTPGEFRKLPALLHRSQVVDCGFKNYLIDELRVEVRTEKDQVPVGRIGAVRGLARNRGRKGRGYWLYLKWTVGRILGPSYE